MILQLFLLFALVPVIELSILIQIGTRVGLVPTVGLVLATGAVGAWLARHEGVAVLRQIADELQSGTSPGTRLVEGGLVVAGAMLLMTPGLLTDLTGFAMIAPVSRRWLAPRVLAYLGRRFEIRTTHIGESEAGPRPRPEVEPRPRTTDEPFDHPMR